MDPIVLASSSPRRQDILKMLNIPFIVHPADIDEHVPEDVDIRDAPEYVACKKVDAVVRQLSQQQEVTWVLGADTLILFKGTVYGKPSSKEEAADMIRQLQGHTHEVITGLALYNGNIHYLSSRTQRNRVTFMPMTDEEQQWYVNTGEWHGAAGAYRVQGLASCFIKSIEGSESGIMGLPLFELYDMLKEQHYAVLT